MGAINSAPTGIPGNCLKFIIGDGHGEPAPTDVLHHCAPQRLRLNTMLITIIATKKNMSMMTRTGANPCHKCDPSLDWSSFCNWRMVFQFLAVPTVFSFFSIKLRESFERPMPFG